jgi:prepilin-type N-terminal cleavage/methylation domain-containing protein
VASGEKEIHARKILVAGKRFIVDIANRSFPGSCSGRFNQFSHAMKIRDCRQGRRKTAFTLVELLTVIAIIAILASLLLVVLPRVLRQGKITKARTEITQLIAGIENYESAYSHFPTTNNATGTMTLGGSVLAGAGFAGAATAPNTEVTAILMNITNVNVTDVNKNGQKNSQQTIYLNAKMTGDTSSPGVGSDLIYRDPWGNPYVISMNLSFADACEDAFYAQPKISAGGFSGLILQADGNYAFHGKIMVWSAGPDGKIDNSGAAKANEGANKDNVLSW